MRLGEIRWPIGIGLGAIAGSLLRYYITLSLNQWLGTAFPFGTFTINLTGAFGLGFFATWVLGRTAIPPEVQLAITVGFFGSYTTFSTYELDTKTLLAGHDWAIALLYWICTAVLGVLCLEAGSLLAKRLVR